MSKTNLPTVERATLDVNAERARQLQALYPEVFSEGQLDADKLRVLLGQAAPAPTERYHFSWAGKNDAVDLIRLPSRATLQPDRAASVNPDTTGHAYIEGDNLEVLKLLQKSYSGRVKLIYIDPPYNTGNDFIYPDDFKDTLANYLRLTRQTDDAGNLLRTNPETSGRYHSDWLSMMYPRLFLARQLLRDDGVIFVSIDDHEVHHLRLLMNEVFGEENFVAEIVWQKVYSPRMDAIGFSVEHDYLICYRKSETFEVNRIGFEQNAKQFSSVDDSGAKYRSRSLRKDGKNSSRTDRPNLFYPLISPDGKEVYPIRSDGSEGCWRWSKDRYDLGVSNNQIEWIDSKTGWQVCVKQFHDENATKPPSTVWSHTEVGHNHEAVEAVKELFSKSVFDNPKPSRLLKRCLEIGTSVEEDDLILDFFSGSGTTAQAVLELNREDGGNRKFILVQLPEPTENKQFPTISSIGMERIRRVIAKLKGETGNILGGGGKRQRTWG